MVLAVIRKRNIKHAHFWLISNHHFTAQSITQQLMTKTNTEIGFGPVPNPFAYGRLLLKHPRMLLFLPGVLGAAKHKKEIVRGKIGNFLPFPQANHFRNNAVFRKEIQKPAWVVMVHVLKNKRALHSIPISLEEGQ